MLQFPQIQEGPVPGTYARCNTNRTLRIEYRLEAKPLGTYSLAGAQMNWPNTQVMRHPNGTSGRIAWSTASRPTSKSASLRCWATHFSTLMATPFLRLRWPLQIKA